MDGWLERAGDELRFHPMRARIRLREMADTAAILQVPEDVAEIPAGALVDIQVLGTPDTRACPAMT